MDKYPDCNDKLLDILLGRIVMDIRVIRGDALKISADVLVLKHAQSLYGVDKLVVDRLEPLLEDDFPSAGHVSLINTHGRLSATSVLFVGVGPLRLFGYEEIRAFSKRALASLAEITPSTAHIAFTLHGAGYGLDESEAFRAELGGILDAVESGEYPHSVGCITIVEKNVQRAKRLQTLLEAMIPSATVESTRGRKIVAATQLEQLRSAGAASKSKPHIFVAMPFAREFEDPFHYGIKQAVNAAGYLCERADLAKFTGDVIAWVKERIETSHLLVAEVSTANPNVYLELGYAWGKGIRTVLVAQEATDLPFDLKGQRCLLYNSIRTLEESLTAELKALT